MIRFILLILICSATSTYADSCYPLYENKSQEIQERDGYDTHIGAQIYIDHGHLGYWPGLPMQAKIPNWSRELIEAVKWGPYSFTASNEDPRKDWLETFRKSISDDCKLPKENYDQLRSMLNELMEDGSFCPNNTILEPKFLKGKSDFKKILKDAVKSGRFSQHCQNSAVVDESHREIKDISPRANKPHSQSSTTPQ